ncbi:E3 ubiquitin-protein ligase TRIM7-like [Zootoca vivipara]|uniref:E3 ubiquitin-protein ligase TRIM7-like n=1 Tax=Zootoca vivipara TaxID=8524 RepID=UPI00293BE367|nr:E3 ubiquitin-protein ligase TRIM7-like [Zootoca vivipara]
MAATQGPVQDLCEEATCPICLECFRDPVIIPECGHNFCRSCLIQCWKKSKGKAFCPQCRKIIQRRNLIPNRPLANVVEKLRLQGEKEAEGKGRVCEKHREPLKLFCKKDGSPICVVCHVSKKHKSHEVVPLEEASQEYKDQISSCLDNVRNEREKILEFKADAEEEGQDLLKQMKAARGKMVAIIRQMQQFLEKQKKLLLAQMAEVEKEIAKKRKEHLAILSGELSSFESAIQEMEEKLQEPASELLQVRPGLDVRGWSVRLQTTDISYCLVFITDHRALCRYGSTDIFFFLSFQDIRSFLRRSQEKENLEDPPVAFPPDLKWRIWDFCDISPFLEGVMKQFRDTVEYGLQLRKEDVTLDPDTANPHLILSKDRKRASSDFEPSSEFPGKETRPFADANERKRNHLSLPGEAAAMATYGGPVQDLCEEATCCICLEYFRDPVIIPECGHNFCRSCLIQYWGESEGEASCPQCRKIILHRNLIPNRPLANVVERLTAGNFRLHGEMEAEGKGKICEKHQEPLKLFCKEDESPICVVCIVSKEHKSHKAILLEEAFQEYKDQISSCLDNLRKERNKILVFKADTEKESQDLLKQMEAEREKMVAEIRQMHQFLEEQEKLLLAQMAEVEKEIAKKREEHLARLSGELSCFEHAIWEMEEKLQEPASELLQDIRSFLQRSQVKEESPVAFPPALKWRIWDFCDINPFLEAVMKKFRDTMEYGLQLRKENITLDPITANPWLILSEDRKSVREGEVCQDLPNSPKRFDQHAYVLGCEEFKEGRHFWEVAVGSEERWGVGVARESVKRKGVLIPGPKEGIWRIGKLDGQYRVSNLAGPPVSLLGGEPKRIRVTLNFEGGRVSFYDADTAVLLHSFSEASFSGETLKPIFFVSEEANLTLS